MTTLLAKEPGKTVELTTESSASHYGIPVLRVTVDGVSADYGPADTITGWPGGVAKDFVRRCCKNTKVDGSSKFLSQLGR